jgi:hypothetical protein
MDKKKISEISHFPEIILTEKQIIDFNEQGVLVIPNVLSEDEINTCRFDFHKYLLQKGVDVNNLEETGGNLANLSSTGGSGGVLDVFYQDWKLKINEHPKVVSIMMNLWKETYSSNNDIFNHSFGEFNHNNGYIYIDRVCYRVPDRISSIHGKGKRKLQRSLTPHLDCCPHKLFTSGDESKASKWRPIQAFIALTDTNEANMGGFEACTGLHKEFNDWVSRRPGGYTNLRNDNINNEVIPPPCIGEFTPIRPAEDKEILTRFRHISCNAGDMVCWDQRIPHANSRGNISNIAREAIYIGLLPATEMNKNYAQQQYEKFLESIVPNNQWTSQNQSIQKCDYEFSPLGNKLMKIEEWC